MSLPLLTGETAGELLGVVLAEAGGELLEWTTGQVDHQPGRRTTASYRASVKWTDGTVTNEVLGASSGLLPENVVRLSDGVNEIGVWRFPDDPDLPALPLAVDPIRARKLIEATGLDVGGDVDIHLRAYRPRRRAVIEIRIPGQRRVFVKVVSPSKARFLHNRHRLAACASVPASLGWTDDGLVVLAGLPGRTLREELLGQDMVEIFPDSVTAALNSLPAELADEPRRRTWGQKAIHYAEVISAFAPSLAAQARDIALAVHHDKPEGPAVPVHGDLYESQLLMHDGHVTGLLDIDTAGSGERSDDAACLLAHLAVLAEIVPDRAAHINSVQHRLKSHFARDLDWTVLRRRTAAVVLSLATGPHRVQEPNWLHNTALRLNLAERWMKSPSP
jgi:hypothetical protein